MASILRAVDYLNARPDVDPDRICIMSGQNLFFEVRAVQHGVRVLQHAGPCCNMLYSAATLPRRQNPPTIDRGGDSCYFSF